MGFDESFKWVSGSQLMNPKPGSCCLIQGVETGPGPNLIHRTIALIQSDV